MRLPDGTFLSAGYGGMRIFEDIKSGKRANTPASGFHKRILSATLQGENVLLGTLRGLWQLKAGDYLNPQPLFEEDPRYNYRINHLGKDEKGHIWVATLGNGLLYYDGKKSYQVRDELNSLVINSFHIEKSGTLWVATNRGLNRLRYTYDPEGFRLLEVNAVTVEDGLPDNDIRAVAFWQGEVWVSGQKGISHFKPNELLKDQLPAPNILLEEVLVDTTVVDHRQPLSLKYDQNDLSLRFASLSQYPPLNQPVFRYRLKEDEQQWTYTNDRQVTLYNVAPGDYQFEVAARNRDGLWSEQPATFDFRIEPHFSQTLWFRFALGSLVLILLFTLFRLRLRRIVQRNQQEKNLQSAQLRAKEAELTVLRNQMNPHFVFNALNAIQTYIFDQDPEQANYYLSRFSHLMRNALQFSTYEKIKLIEEIDFLETYLELESIRFPGAFSTDVRVEKGLNRETIWVPPFLLQPLLENSIKHGFKGIKYPGKLEVHFSREGSEGLLILVRDNGKGLGGPNVPKPDYYKSMGLGIVRNRIQLINEGGEEASFDWKDRGENSGESGIEVIIRLPAGSLTLKKGGKHA